MRRLSIIFPTPHHLPHKNHPPLSLPSSQKPSTTPTTAPFRRRHKKIIVIMGPTGCGKSKLSVDLASRFFQSSEVINSDKIQAYRGLNITTNKIPLPERRGVRHHLIGEFDSSDSHPEFTPSDFRSAASSVISQIHSRRRIPLIVGGSNSFIYALLAKKYNPGTDVFTASGNPGSNSAPLSRELRYRCCFIWVDVALPVLYKYLIKRVDDMLDSGMFEELSEYFQNRNLKCGLNKAIGVPEFERYFNGGDDVDKGVVYEEAVRGIKDNTCQLAKRQLEKILRLRDEAGWEVKRVDATAAFRAAAEGRRVAEIWEREVVEPSVKIVKQFLME